MFLFDYLSFMNFYFFILKRFSFQENYESFPLIMQTRKKVALKKIKDCPNANMLKYQRNANLLGFKINTKTTLPHWKKIRT